MIETQSTTTLNPAPEQTTKPQKKIFKMRDDDRMAGGVPVWEPRNTAKEHVEGNLADALNNQTQTFDQALAYADQSIEQQPNEEFGFGDLIDMINPLHHIPLVGDVYRHVTGDEIKSASRIIGGAAFGGPAGAAGSFINVIVEHETGKDIAGNVMGLVVDGEAPAYRSDTNTNIEDHPEKRLNQAAKDIENNATADLPASVLSFTDIGGGKKRIVENIPFADGRTAGHTQRVREDIPFLGAKREPITELILGPLPKINEEN